MSMKKPEEPLEYQVNSSDRRKVNSTLTVNDFNSTEVGSPEDRSTSSNPFDHPNSDQGNSNEYQTFNMQMELTDTPKTEMHPTTRGDGIGNTENVSTQGPDSGSTTTVVDSRAKSFSRDISESCRAKFRNTIKGNVGFS